MASPQSSFFVRYPKELYDAATRAGFSATQMQVFLVVVRMTYGDRGRKQALVSIGAMQKATRRSRSVITAAVHDLLANGVLSEVAAPGFGRARELAIQNDYERWGKYSVAPKDVPSFLRHDWENEQGGRSEQALQSDHPCTGRATTPVPAERTGQGGQSDPTKDKTPRGKDGDSPLVEQAAQESSEPHGSEPPCGPSSFEDFWAACLLRVGKAGARQQWAILDATDRAAAVAGALRWASYYQTAGTEQRFIKQPENFLRDRRYDDEPPLAQMPSAVSRQDPPPTCQECGEELSPAERANDALTEGDCGGRWWHRRCARQEGVADASATKSA